MPDSDKEYSETEATKRMDDALRRALSTPHKPNKKFVGKSLKTEKVKPPKPKRKR